MTVVPAKPIRYRRRRGEPRCAVEHVLQWAWRWRVELMLAWLVVWAVAASAIELWGR